MINEFLKIKSLNFMAMDYFNFPFHREWNKLAEWNLKLFPMKYYNKKNIFIDTLHDMNICNGINYYIKYNSANNI